LGRSSRVRKRRIQVIPSETRLLTGSPVAPQSSSPAQKSASCLHLWQNPPFCLFAHLLESSPRGPGRNTKGSGYLPPGASALAQFGILATSKTFLGLPRRFPFARAFRRPAFTRFAINERSSSATAPRTVKIIFPAGVDVSICSLRLTKAMPRELKVSRTRSSATPTSPSDRRTKPPRHRTCDGAHHQPIELRSLSLAPLTPHVDVLPVSATTQRDAHSIHRNPGAAFPVTAHCLKC